ncbi:hypothetical protein ABIB51_004359 [Arthrobacter sp. UYCu712]
MHIPGNPDQRRRSIIIKRNSPCSLLQRKPYERTRKGLLGLFIQDSYAPPPAEKISSEIFCN